MTSMKIDIRNIESCVEHQYLLSMGVEYYNAQYQVEYYGDMIYINYMVEEEWYRIGSIGHTFTRLLEHLSRYRENNKKLIGHISPESFKLFNRSRTIKQLINQHKVLNG